MGVETLLLLAGSVAGVVIIGIIAYRGISNKSTGSPSTIIHEAQTPNVSPDQTNQLPETFNQESHTDSAQAATAPIFVPSVATALVPEAPAPFPEESSTSPATQIPTDVSAVSNISNPADVISPVLVIATPKRRARSSRRLPSATNSTEIKRKRVRKTVAPTATTPTTTKFENTVASEEPKN